MAFLETLSTTILPEAYLDAEAGALKKHEFNNGNIVEMAGGDIDHNLLKGEIFTLLKQWVTQRQSSFLVLDSDMKIWFATENRFVYPDITVAARPPQFYIAESGKIRRDALVNPTLIVEVLSDETRAYEKGDKFDLYCTLPSFREYLLIEPGKPWAKTIWLENPDLGIQRVHTATAYEDSIYLHSLDCTLHLKEIYQVLNYQ